MISPVFKVREFKVEDVMPYAIKFSWEGNDKGEAREMKAFSTCTPIPCTKLLTFYRREPFDVEASYCDADLFPKGTKTWLGRFTVSKVKPDSNGEPSTVKVKVRLNPNGILEATGAQAIEEKVVEDTATDESKPETQETEENKQQENGATANPPAGKKQKKSVNKTDLPVSGTVSALPKDKLLELRELENGMVSSDKLVVDTEERRNTLEAYVYEMRGKLECEYQEYVEDKVLSNLPFCLFIV